MAKKLTATEANASRALLHDLFEAGGLLKYPIRTEGRNYIKEYCREAATVVCKEIKNRTFNFLETDYALNDLTSCWLYQLREPSKPIKLNANNIANIIAAFCVEQEIFWDDVNTARTRDELETYRKSMLGAACWSFECFLSQQAGKGPDAFAAKYAAKRTAPKTTRKSSTPRDPSKITYKATGGRSGMIKGLIGKPGEKITFGRGDYLYSILCDSSKTKPQFAFIDPVNKLADPNIVRLGDPSGYTACKLFFKTVADAEAAIEKIKESIDIPDHITRFSPARATADANGYFLVNTEIGPAYIKARKLNENIAEELDETEIIPARTTRFPEIDDVDTYTEAFFRE